MIRKNSFIDKLINNNISIWNKCINHNFFVDFANKNISSELFEQYLVQDIIYLQEFKNSFTKMINISNNPKFNQFIQNWVKNSIDIEIEIQKKFKYQNKDASISTKKYLTYLKKYQNDDFKSLLISTLACAYSYMVGANKAFNNLKITNSLSPEAELWFSAYTSKNAIKWLENFGELLDEIFVNDDGMIEKYSNIFYEGCLLEIIFFNQIYPKHPPTVLAIAGSDSICGAGIQADIKSITFNNCYATTAITAITSQNTQKVSSIFNIPPNEVINQIKSVFDDEDPYTIKIGMLSNKKTIKSITEFLKPKNYRVILDPVMVSETKSELLENNSLKELKELIKISYLITPNIYEAQKLTGIDYSEKNIISILSSLKELGSQYVLLKGGHSEKNCNNKIIDYLYDGNTIYKFFNNYINTKNLHGTGCCLSSAIAANLAQGFMIEEAVKKSVKFVNNAIKQEIKIGKGQGPINISWFLQKSNK